MEIDKDLLERIEGLRLGEGFSPGKGVEGGEVDSLPERQKLRSESWRTPREGANQISERCSLKKS
jgi:hypothetical protein